MKTYTIQRGHLLSALTLAVETLATENGNGPDWKSTNQQVLEEALDTLRDGGIVEIHYSRKAL